jgi:hypothetical protein
MVDVPPTSQPPDENNPTVYHADFSDLTDDICLIARADEARFLTHSLILRRASGFFRDTLSLPQPPIAQGSTPAEHLEIRLDESAPIVEALLRVCMAKRLPRIDDLDFLEEFADAADKYDMPASASLAQRLIVVDPFIQNPMRAYVIACRFGWQDEAVSLSEKTLAHDITDLAHAKALSRIDGKSLLLLVRLHRARATRMQALLEGPLFTTDGSPCDQDDCGKPRNGAAWNCLKFRIYVELTKHPRGDTITDSGFEAWPETANVRDAISDCGRAYYSLKLTRENIATCIAQLPRNTDDVSLYICSLKQRPY